MIVTCPQCATRYEAPESSFEPNGRKVKCSACAYTWFQTPPMADLVPSAEPEGEAPKPDKGGTTDIETEAARLAAASRRASRKFANIRAERSGSIKGWAALAALVAVLAVVGFFGRVQVVGIFPAAASLYSKIGVEVNVRGLEFEGVRYERAFENGIPILQVTGTIVNVSDEERLVPRIRFGLFDGSRHEVYHWTMAVDRDPLEPGKGVNFSTRLAAPPETAREVQVRFVGDAG